MCDTLVAVHDDAVWLAKNSDREPGEAQAIEHAPAGERRPDAPDHGLGPPKHAAILCRPVWMWGAEMGVNARGVAIGNEAVFTRAPVPDRGLTGMDLLRAALGHADTAREAIDVIAHLLERHPQGGVMGFRDRNFRYHSSFAVADPTEAWIVETAGQRWAAQRVRDGVRAISNALTLDVGHDLASDDVRRSKRGFAAAWGKPSYRALAGADVRRARHEAAVGPGRSLQDFLHGLRSHGGEHPLAGWRSRQPCAHASWWPTRAAGQTTGSLIARLAPGDIRVWATGTSSPCLSVFKPVDLDGRALAREVAPSVRRDETSLWWRHERLHRATLLGYGPRRAAFEADRAELEADALARRDPATFAAAWETHRAALPEWLRRAEGAGIDAAHPVSKAWWLWQRRRDGR